MLKWPILLFDFDGTLVSTEELAQEAIHSYFAEKKIPNQDFFASLVIGRTWRAAAELVEAEAKARQIKIDPPPELIRAWKLRYQEKVQQGVKIIPGLVKKLEALRDEGAIMGIVTGSDSEEVQAILKQQNLGHFFLKTWSSGDYSHSKPHPAPYLKAMTDLGAEPEKVMVFEDSVAGCESSFQAGLPWIQVLFGNYTTPDARSYQQIKTWDELDLKWLRK